MPTLCPCGSGLKLIDCCVSHDIADIKNKNVNAPQNSKRRQWAQRYLKYKAILNEQITEAQEDYTRSIGKKIPCKPGCSMCCNEFIAARLEECDAIAMYLYSDPLLMQTFIINYHDWHERLSSGDNILEKTTVSYQTLFKTRNPNDKKMCDAYILKYAETYTPCPFLKDDKCLIYPIRPFVCSVYCVLSDKKYCDPRSHKQAPTEHVKLKSATHPLSFENTYYTDLQGRTILGAMPKMVYDILRHGPPAV